MDVTHIYELRNSKNIKTIKKIYIDYKYKYLF